MPDHFHSLDQDLWDFTPHEEFDRLTCLANHLLGAKNAFLFATAPAKFNVISGSLEQATAEFDFFRSLCCRVLAADDVVMSAGSHDPTRDLVEDCIGVPIRDHEADVIGVLVVTGSNSRVWTDSEIGLLQELAACIQAHLALHFEKRARIKAETAHRASEKRLVAMADHIPGLVFERRKLGEFGSRYTLLGSSGPNGSGIWDLTHDRPTGFIHPDDRDRFDKAIRDSTITETDLDLTFRKIESDGSVRWLSSKSFVRRDEDDIAVWDGICLDITDLVEAKEAARTARRVRDALVLEVDAEIREPLSAIIGFTDVLKTESKPDRVRAHAQTIQNASEGMLSIVDQLLDLAGADGRLDCSPTPIAALVKTCQSLVAPRARRKNLVSSVVIDADVPPNVHVDGPKVQQVLVNLLINAIKHTDEGSITLRVSHKPDRMRFSVADTGIGIPEDKILGLFDRAPGVEADSLSPRGAGLGLVIVKQLVEQMGGMIGASSTIDRGTTFWFEIAARETGAPKTESTEMSWQTETSVGARILIADDLDLNRKLIADMLSIDGHVIDCVSDGAEALEAASLHDYDLILMDMIMPVMDGITATRAIRALPAPACDVAIIALTAHSFKEQLDSCLAAGMNATITKPMSLDTLTSMVRDWTRGKTRAA